MHHRVRSISLVHDRLYRSPDLAAVDMREYLVSLVNEIAATYSATCPCANVTVDADPVLLGVDKATPLGLLLKKPGQYTAQDYSFISTLKIAAQPHLSRNISYLIFFFRIHSHYHHSLRIIFGRSQAECFKARCVKSNIAISIKNRLIERQWLL